MSTYVHHPGDAWQTELTMPVGSVMHIELHPAGGYRWSGIEASDPAVVRAGGAVRADGVAVFDIVAEQLGRVTLSATTEFQGDRFGPPVRRWTMALYIVSNAAYPDKPSDK